MVNMRELWQPVAVSSVLAFAASSLIWMVLGYHKNDMTGVTDEEAMRDALRKQNLAPGQYVIPHHKEMAEMKSPEFQKKMADGPLAFIVLRPPGQVGMGKMLGQWFIYLLILNSVIAYAASRSLMAHEADYMTVFRMVAAIAFLAYGGAHGINSVFWGRPWRVTVKDLVDALIYALLAAGSFGWLWPR